MGLKFLGIPITGSGGVLGNLYSATVGQVVGPNSITGQAYDAVGSVAQQLGNTIESIASDPKKLAAVGLMVAFPGAAGAIGDFILGDALAVDALAASGAMTASEAALAGTASLGSGSAASAIIGQTAINTALNGGNFEQAVKSALVQQGLPAALKSDVMQSLNKDMVDLFGKYGAQAATQAGLAAIMGKDPVAAFVFSGASSAVNLITKEIPGWENLPGAVQKSVNSALLANLTGKDAATAAASSLVGSAINAGKNYATIQSKLEPTGRMLTAEQLADIPMQYANIATLSLDRPQNIQNISKYLDMVDKGEFSFDGRNMLTLGGSAEAPNFDWWDKRETTQSELNDIIKQNLGQDWDYAKLQDYVKGTNFTNPEIWAGTEGMTQIYLDRIKNAVNNKFDNYADASTASLYGKENDPAWYYNRFYGWDSLDQKDAAKSLGISNPNDYALYLEQQAKAPPAQSVEQNKPIANEVTAGTQQAAGVDTVASSTANDLITAINDATKLPGHGDVVGESVASTDAATPGGSAGVTKPNWLELAPGESTKGNLYPGEEGTQRIDVFRPHPTDASKDISYTAVYDPVDGSVSYETSYADPNGVGGSTTVSSATKPAWTFEEDSDNGGAPSKQPTAVDTGAGESAESQGSGTSAQLTDDQIAQAAGFPSAEIFALYGGDIQQYNADKIAEKNHQDIMDTFHSVLGRDPTPEEYAQFAGQNAIDVTQAITPPTKVVDSGGEGTSGGEGASGGDGSSGAGTAQTGGSGVTDGGAGTEAVSGYSGVSGIEPGGTADVGRSGESGGVSGGESGDQSGIEPGASGYSGYSGLSGEKGGTGETGDVGDSGYSGYSGLSGTTGASGYSGVSGTTGTSGYSGTAGRAGADATSSSFGAQFGSAGTGAVAGPTASELKPQFLTSKASPYRFTSPLAAVLALSKGMDTGENQAPQGENPMQTPHYSYGNVSSIDEILGMPDYFSALGGGSGAETPMEAEVATGGLMSSPLMAAAGGVAGTRYGKYASGGLPGNVVHHSGKARVDFRHGDAVTGAGDGQSDDIPAMLADGEFVIPADVVAAIGNGSTKAGSDKLYDMMHGIRAHVRSAKPKDLPPEIKSPLDFLGKKHRKA